MELQCRNCLEVKREDEFYNNRTHTTRNGRDYWCIQCRTKKSKKAYQDGKKLKKRVDIADDSYIYCF